MPLGAVHPISIERASLSLMRSDGGSLHLMLRAKLPEWSVLRLPDGGRTHFSINFYLRASEAGWKARPLEIERAELLAPVVAHALLTTPLSAARLEHLAAALDPFHADCA